VQPESAVSWFLDCWPKAEVAVTRTGKMGGIDR
jgi:hypothetical protein